MSSVWVIEDGEYSDYHVVGVFSSRENAEEVRRRLASTTAEIVSWPLDPAITELNAGLYPFYVHILRDGSVVEAKACEVFMEPYDWIGVAGKCHPSSVGLRTHVYAKDEEHAVKIANEKRIELIASGRWSEG